MKNFYQRLIKPIRDDHITTIISSFNSSIYSPYDEKLNWEERKIPIQELFNTTEQFVEKWLTGLQQFPYRYVTNGNTHSIETLFNRYPNMAFKNNEYIYYSAWHNAMKKNYRVLEMPGEVDDLIFTWPGYKWGDSTEYNFAAECKAKRLHMDCAYLGLVKPSTINCSKLETVSISFSKTCSIPYNRIGILYSKSEITELSTLNSLGYINLAGAKIATGVIRGTGNTYWWDKYGGKTLNYLCSKYNLVATDCILFAYKDNTRISLAPYWKMLMENNYDFK